MTIEERINGLEHGQRRWKWAAISLSVFLIGVFSIGGSRDPEDIEVRNLTAKTIIVGDGSGGTISIGTSKDDGVILVKSPHEDSYVRISAVRAGEGFSAHASIEANAHAPGKIVGGSSELEATDATGRILIFKGGASRADLVFEQPQPPKP